MAIAGARAGRNASAGPHRLKDTELTVLILIPTLTPEEGGQHATINLKRL